MDEMHLNMIAKNKSLNKDDRSRLFLKPGKLPTELDFPKESLSAIHLCRMMHFFTPDEVEGMFQNAASWLMDGGILYITIMSPYHQAVKGFDKIYENRFLKGDEWPGVITDFLRSYGKDHIGKAPNYQHAIDPRVMKKLATKHGFIVKRIELFGGPEDMDYTGAILIKVR
jgi:SAM-dependent methyltransferase